MRGGCLGSLGDGKRLSCIQFCIFPLILGYECGAMAYGIWVMQSCHARPVGFCMKAGCLDGMGDGGLPMCDQS